MARLLSSLRERDLGSRTGAVASSGSPDDELHELRLWCSRAPARSV